MRKPTERYIPKLRQDDPGVILRRPKGYGGESEEIDCSNSQGESYANAGSADFVLFLVQSYQSVALLVIHCSVPTEFQSHHTKFPYITRCMGINFTLGTLI